MFLKDLEARRDEIIGFNNDIAKQVENMRVESTKLQEDFNAKAKLYNENFAKLIEQNKINLGALSEIQNWIDAIKAKEDKLEVSDNVVPIDKKKKEK